MTDLDGVVGAIRDADRLLIACHVDPDPDCVGSMLALHWLFQKLGKKSVPVSHDAMLPQWSFFPFINEVVSPHDIDAAENSWDALIVVDCEPNRIGHVSRLTPSVRRVINIDHHRTNEGTADVNFIRPEAAATGELIFEILAAFDIQPDADVSTLLFAAIMSDTGSFRFSNTTAKTFETTATLVENGARPDVIYSHIYERRSKGYLRLLGLVLNGLERSEDGHIAWIELTQNMLENAGAREDETDGFIQYPRLISDVNVAILFHELPAGEIRVSLRSDSEIDVGLLAQHFGGGGHSKAAGCKVPGSMADVKRRVIERVTQALSTIQRDET